MTLPGKMSATFRKHCIKQLRRLMAGDVTLIPEIEHQNAQVSDDVQAVLLGDLPQANPVPFNMARDQLQA
jgi:hypothetical protein